MLLFNPVVVSVLLLVVLCMFKLNVLLSLLVAGIVAGLTAGMPIWVFEQGTWQANILGGLPGFGTEGEGIISTIIGGMGSMAETALAYILIGMFAYAIGKSGLITILAQKVSKIVGKNKFYLIFLIAFISIFSQNLLPVHISFIPILIPPLLGLMNKLKIDRRAVASALCFGLKAPYISIPAGFGLIFHKIIASNMTDAGMPTTVAETQKVMWIGGLSMLVGLIFVVFALYGKDREYKDVEIPGVVPLDAEVHMTPQAWGALVAALAMLIVQIITTNLPFSALVGIIFLLITRSIKWKEIDEMVNGGLDLMAFIAFVMLIAGGYANVLNTSGAVVHLVNDTAVLMEGASLVVSAIVLLAIGLVITMGIGTSFGTIPVVAAIYVPLAQQLGFSKSAIILLIGIAAALGDAGSPASDSTMGPTSGLNADGQHDHIWDTCVPTFIAFDVFLVIGGVIGAVVLS
ncbi:sodium:proton antiporter [Peptoniphilus sp. AGMB00490]|uniref:Sodium:proton antiporter n=1 Tax=Peptoniphilus faecalis TaxID=2731255 RepID=A0A848RLE1_9FIRM|nr:Na+/H+ antiporter NhaC family protein [Peptoniphilus faecalis]NMW85956.1 sodium:proton antiporter [Peptoniphilus faecalis]